MSAIEQTSTISESEKNLADDARNALAAEVANDEEKFAKEALMNPTYLAETKREDNKLFAFMDDPFSQLKEDIPKKSA